MGKICPIMTGDTLDGVVWFCHEGMPSCNGDMPGEDCCQAWGSLGNIDYCKMMRVK